MQKKLLGCAALCSAFVVGVMMSPVATSVQGQDKSKSSKKSAKGRKGPQANTKALDIKTDQLQSSFTRDAEDLAMQYIEAGHLEKARALLESVLAVNPQATEVQRKLEQLKEGILNSNDNEFDLNPSYGWTSTGAMVFEGKAVRIKAEGTYRFEFAASGLSAAGFPEKDQAADLVPGLPCGALIGVIIGDQKPGKPFLVGESLDLTPKETGILMLRVNAPPGNKNSGRLRISISGSVQTK
jgi:hypothetical protein